MADFPIKVTAYSLAYVIANNRTLFNVLNLFRSGRPPPDYVSVCALYSTDRFLPQFHAGAYHVLELAPADLEWMKRAQLVQAQTGRFSPLFADDLRRSCERHEQFMSRLLSISDQWFIRSEEFSLKKSPMGVGPYSSLKTILPAVLWYNKGHGCLSQKDRTKTLYFVPWRQMDKNKEFRVFVCRGKVTAISQQFLYDVNPWLAAKSEDEIREICRKISDAHAVDFRSKLEYLGDRYVMDVVLLGDEEEPYFIEPNPFGAEYSSGSALFHWIADADALEGRGEFEFRFVDRP
jgi:hypothetical protein